MTPPPPLVVTLTVVPGLATETWCTACRAYTRLTGPLLLLTPQGVSTVGQWTYCDICDDPEDQRPGGTR